MAEHADPSVPSNEADGGGHDERPLKVPLVSYPLRDLPLRQGRHQRRPVSRDLGAALAGSHESHDGEILARPSCIRQRPVVPKGAERRVLLIGHVERGEAVGGDHVRTACVSVRAVNTTTGCSCCSSPVPRARSLPEAGAHRLHQDRVARRHLARERRAPGGLTGSGRIASGSAGVAASIYPSGGSAVAGRIGDVVYALIFG